MTAVATSRLRGVVRAAGFLSLSGLLVLASPLFLPFGLRGRQALRRQWSRGSCRILGIRVIREGAPFRHSPTLVVANHVSYLDVIAVGSHVDDTFIAKAEVDGWPLFGFLSRTVGTYFVRRHWRQALVQRNAIAARMRAGEGFVLFAEGTSTNGLSLRPFKTSLMSVAEPWVLDRPVAVQPMTVVYTRLRGGEPITATNCDLYAWWGDMELAPHLWQVLQMEGVEVRIVLHEPVMSWSVRSRKVLGRELQDLIGLTLAARRGGVHEPTAAAGESLAAQLRAS